MRVFRRFLLVTVPLFLSGWFVYAYAQENLSAMPDLLIRDIRLSNYTLNFTVENFTFADLSSQYPVSVKAVWLDAGGQPIDDGVTNHIMNGMASRALQNFVFDYATIFDFNDYAENRNLVPFFEYLFRPPRNGTRLKLTLLSGPDRRLENNTLEVPRPTYPDLFIDSANFTSRIYEQEENENSLGEYRERLQFSMRSTGPIIQQEFQVFLEWLDADNNQVFTEQRNTAGNMIPYRGKIRFPRGLAGTYDRGGYYYDSNEITSDNPEEGVRIDGFTAIPVSSGAVGVRITVNDQNDVYEENPDNNVLVVDRELANLIIRDPALTNNQLTLTLLNGGTGPTNERPPLEFQWLDRGGHPIGSSLNMYIDTIIPAGGSFVFDSNSYGRRGDPHYNVYEYFSNQPTEATRLRVMVNPLSHSRRFIYESDFSDNNTTINRPLPDLTFNSAVWTDEGWRFSVSNQGTKETGPRIGIRIYWLSGGGEILNPNDEEGLLLQRVLAPKETFLFDSMALRADGNFTAITKGEGAFRIPEGAKKLRLVVDDPREIFETEENNNSIEVDYLASDANPEEILTADENLAAEKAAADQNISSRPKILPGNPLYVFKSADRVLRSLFTFGDKEKAELHLRFANAKILEANLLSDRGEINRAAGHLKSYIRELEKVEQWTEILGEKDEEAAQKLAEKTATSALQHQILLGKIEKNAPADNLVAVKEERGRATQQISNSIARIKDSEKIESVLALSLEPNGSPFHGLRNLEVLKAVEEQVPDEAKDALRHAEENVIKRFKNQLEALPEQYQKLLPQYVEHAGGNEISYVKTFDDVKRFGLKEETVADVLKAEEKILEKIRNRLEEAQKKDPASAEQIVTPILGGSMEDLRALKDIERSSGPEVAESIERAKKRIIERLLSKDPTILEKESKRFGDVRQLVVLEDIKRLVPKNAEADKIQKDLSKDIVRNLAGATKEADRKILLEKIADASPDAIPVVSETFKNTPSVRDPLIEKHLRKISRNIDAVEDPKRADQIRKELFNPKTKEVVTRIEPNVFEEIGTKTEIGHLRMECNDRLQVLRKEAEELYKEFFEKLGRSGPLGTSRLAALVVNTNLQALDAQRRLNETQEALGEVFQRISSGLRINSAADDAQGLGITERLDAELRVLREAVQSANQSISSIQATDGAYAELNTLLTRMRELAVESADSLLQDADRSRLDREYQTLVIETRRLMRETALEGEALLNTDRFSGTRVDSKDTRDIKRLIANIDDTLSFTENGRTQLADKAQKTIRPCEEEEKKMRAILKEVRTHKKSKVEPMKPQEKPIEKSFTEPKETEMVCVQVYLPVCGSDGKTYSNRCVAEKQQGVKVAYEGECKQPIKIITPPPAPPPTTTVCPTDYAPICGADSKTYTNSCYAKQVGVEVQYNGECKIITYQCGDSVDNDKDGYIDLKDPGCADTKDNDETDAPIVVYQCSDGVDNDKDGSIDLKDPGCNDPQDGDEADEVTQSTVPSPLADLYVQEIISSPLPLTVGGSVSFRVTIKNQGAAKADLSSSARLRIDKDSNGTWDVIPASATVSALDASKGETKYWFDVWKAAAGSHATEVCLDINNQVSEVDELNNCVSVILKVQ